MTNGDDGLCTACGCGINRQLRMRGEAFQVTGHPEETRAFLIRSCSPYPDGSAGEPGELPE